MSFCCFQLPVIEEQKPLIVDLQKILIERAWKNFRFGYGPIRRSFLKREKFIIEVPENYFTFEKVHQVIKPRFQVDPLVIDNNHVDTNHSNRTDLAIKDTGDKSGLTATTESQAPFGLPRHTVTGPEHISLDTEFSNKTAKQQTYKFRFEKQRKSEISVSFQKGFTIGGSAKFNIGIPVPGAEAGVETTMQYQVTKTEGQRFEETMLMEATSDIQVGPNSCYIARVQLEERPVHSDFEVHMRMELPQGRAPVYIKRKEDNEIIFVYNVKNLFDIFESVPCAKPVIENGRKRQDQMDFVVLGVLKGSIACQHRIHLSSDESMEMKQKARQEHSKFS